MRGIEHKIEKLELLNPRSTEFCEIAAHYFYARFRVFRTGGAVFLFLGILSIPGSLFMIGHWHLLFCVANFVGGIFFTVLGWLLFNLGRNAINMIKAAQMIDGLNQRREVLEGSLAKFEPAGDFPKNAAPENLRLDTIRCFANGVLRNDEISKVILKRLANEADTACLAWANRRRHFLFGGLNSHRELAVVQLSTVAFFLSCLSRYFVVKSPA